MEAVLRQRDVPLHESLSILADAMQRELPRHVRSLASNARRHSVLVPAFYGGETASEARLYTIDLVYGSKNGNPRFVVVRHDMERTGAPTPVTMTGSGGRTLFSLMKERQRKSTLRHLVRACDERRIKPHSVADYLARLNSEVHAIDSSVGPRCLVVWRNRLGGIRRGGGWLYYNGTNREYASTFESPQPPLVSTGMGAYYRAMIRDIARTSGTPMDSSLEERINVDMGLPAVLPEEKLR